MYVFFFFKQKTAYEMRISDWSSDVCSSDLSLRARRGQGQAPRQGHGQGVEDGRRGHLLPGGLHRRDRPEEYPRELTPRPTTERKSVASGKSVSVRVDLGGRRIIKKKNH